jgi:hypothetical protein
MDSKIVLLKDNSGPVPEEVKLLFKNRPLEERGLRRSNSHSTMRLMKIAHKYKFSKIQHNSL